MYAVGDVNNSWHNLLNTLPVYTYILMCGLEKSESIVKVNLSTIISSGLNIVEFGMINYRYFNKCFIGVTEITVVTIIMFFRNALE